jgi:hypothetical protein
MAKAKFDRATSVRSANDSRSEAALTDRGEPGYINALASPSHCLYTGHV